MNSFIKTFLLVSFLTYSFTFNTIAQSRGLTLNRTVENALPVNSKAYALIVATDEYENFDNLNNPVYDAMGVSKILKEGYDFDVKVLKSPSKDELLTAIREYHNILNKEDRFLLYLAGHGIYETKYYEEGFVVLSDSETKGYDPNLLTYASFHDVKTLTDKLPSQQVLMVVDVCFGGAFNDKITKGRSIYDASNSEMTAEDFLRFQLEEKNRYVLSSGKLNTVSDGIKGQHSPFAEKLIKSLSEHKRDSIVTAQLIKQDLRLLKSQPILGSFSENVGTSEFVFKAKASGPKSNTLVFRAEEEYYKFLTGVTKYKLDEPFLITGRKLEEIAKVFQDASVDNSSTSDAALGMFWLLVMNKQQHQVELTTEEEYYAKEVIKVFQEEERNGINDHLWHLATIQALDIHRFTDDDQVLTLYKRAMSEHQMKSFWYAGQFALKLENKAMAYNFFEKGAKLNDPFSQYGLAMLKYNDRHYYELDKPIDDYIKYLEKASENGLRRASDVLFDIN
ncbi:caspase family protein [Flammeovirga kamogawensis]|uniref:Caspase family protein n=1 Tax=Flammeovirga kamogawensis TaxID=373891 RepID=A0ABX8H391_9BACT|nr:caspase family protein [Flammeovirga kamogawensis]MBB6463141.1 hypothetical protein [Flammeovirga kamogawensis]QWG10375.1 caspase family protein [Flammeovirga kamogawensis]TRX63885.1 caspase family protein [Flammeovirga kamogawensis]